MADPKTTPPTKRAGDGVAKAPARARRERAAPKAKIAPAKTGRDAGAPPAVAPPLVIKTDNL